MSTAGPRVFFSDVSDPKSWNTNQTMKCAGAKTLAFIKFDTHTLLQATTAKGKTYSEAVGLDGPLAACGRLSTKIRRDIEFGKRRREFRDKQRSILIRRKYG